MTTGQINPRYGNASATAPPWQDIEDLLTAAQLYWLISVRTDSRPHAAPLVGVWHGGAFAFCTGEDEQKARNIDANPQIAIATGPIGAKGWASGKDIVAEGTATRVTDADELRALADAWLAKYGEDWHWEVRGTRFFEVSSSGDGTEGGAIVYRVRPSKVMVFGDSHGQTVYRL